MLATADGVEYVSKGGSSLTVITRSKSLNQSNSMGFVNSEASMNTPGGGMRMKSSGELKVEDDGDQYYYQEVLGGQGGPRDLDMTPQVIGDESPEK